MKNHHAFDVLRSCPICHKQYDAHWKVVNHIRKKKDQVHQSFLESQEKQYIQIYDKSTKEDFYQSLADISNIFAGTSFAHNSKILKKKYSSFDLEIIRRQRISNKLSGTKKTKQHAAKVSVSLKDAWRSGKFDKKHICKVCRAEFCKEGNLKKHFYRYRKEEKHCRFISEICRLSFDRNDALSFLRKNHMAHISIYRLRKLWKGCFSKEERIKRRNRIIGWKNSRGPLTEDQKRKVSEGLKRAYREGRKLPPMKGKRAHNKGIPCSEKQKKQISKTLRRKYASGEIKINNNNGNEFHYGYRQGISHFCRSSWEANLARFFNFYNVDYEYEKHKFVLQHDDMGPLVYLPDFYLIKSKVFFEVKGRYEDISKLKHKLFKQQYPQHKLVILNRTKYFKVERRLCRRIPGWELSRKNKDLEKYLIKDHHTKECGQSLN